MTEEIRVHVYRGDGSGGTMQEFLIPAKEALSVMAILAIVHGRDSSFACRTSMCYKGKCGSCLVRVNGRDVFGCTTLISPGETVVIEPHSKFSLIRDTVVDFSQPVAGKGKEGSSHEN